MKILNIIDKILNLLKNTSTTVYRIHIHFDIQRFASLFCQVSSQPFNDVLTAVKKLNKKKPNDIINSKLFPLINKTTN